MTGSIVGVWMLRSFHMEAVGTTERWEPFGPEPRGTLILLPEGRMVALVTPGLWTVPAIGTEVAPEAPKLVAYSGRYRLEPPDRLVTSVDVAGFAAWVGTDQLRTYRLDGDRLDVFTPPGPMPRPGAEPVAVIGVLSWDRENALPA